MSDEKKVREWKDQARKLFMTGWSPDDRGEMRTLENGMTIRINYAKPGYQPIIEWFEFSWLPYYSETSYQTLDEAKEVAWNLFKAILALQALGEKGDPAKVEMTPS